MHTLSILVLDNEQIAIENVSLVLTYNNQTYQQYSNNLGRTSFTLPQISNQVYDVATLVINKTNYQQKTYIDLQIFPDVNSSLNVILQSDAFDDEIIIIEPHKLLESNHA